MDYKLMVERRKTQVDEKRERLQAEIDKNKSEKEKIGALQLQNDKELEEY